MIRGSSVPNFHIPSRFAGSRWWLVVLLVTAIASFAACGGTAEPTSTPTQPSERTAESGEFEVVFSPKQRVTGVAAPGPDLEALVEGNIEFALDLYQVLSQEGEGNLFYSPYSISIALAMTYAGARGETEKQMADALSFTLAQERLHPAFNALVQALASRGENVQEDRGTRFELSIANSLWGQEGFEFRDEFLDGLAENYGAGMRLVDFVGAPEESRVLINNWVEEQTEDRIKDLIPQGIFDMFTRLVLTNAIYFNASWARQFNAEATADDAFFRLDGSTVTVPMMKQSATFLHAAGDRYQAVELLYAGHETSMVVILPDSGRFAEFESRLDADALREIIDGVQRTQVTLSMPHFGFESEFRVSDALKTLGMPIAFTAAADFSGMTTQADLRIEDVLHKAFVSVDEQGTEAAAATAVIVEAVIGVSRSATMTVDRPFIFLIRDRPSGTVLFLGRVMDPSE